MPKSPTTHKYISDCCNAAPKGGLHFEPAMFGKPEGPRQGRCSECEHDTNFHINLHYTNPPDPQEPHEKPT